MGRCLLLVVLDDVRRSLLGVGGVEPGTAACLPLAEQVPGAVEGALQVCEPGVLRGGQAAAVGVRSQQPVLLVRELLDARV